MTKSIILQRLSATVQFILGFLIGISLIVGVTGSMVFVYYKKMSTLPKKPDFPIASTESIPNNTESATTIEPLESNTTEDVEEAEIITEEAEVEPEVEPELPDSAYYATVTWPQGLSLRAEPDLNSGRVGGIEFESKIIILEDSVDGKWQRVRLPWSQQEGWVKGGNTERNSY
ncbi:SH3 domain-containing protein [Waterburya agarophytonicola K14]|uniref:SH3 domain-containing protein n=1 Tax=Waterburya agarophytonicola KI4 TaxID=2874699 RepID=A0A964BST8_9CYAN|nr:SH3 domain-containing protein [Waterburya agarophytonicola]MCC0177893.1 SH3 domain-containing protein [Waterburya agarophytonicola KI4]